MLTHRPAEQTVQTLPSYSPETSKLWTVSLASLPTWNPYRQGARRLSFIHPHLHCPPLATTVNSFFLCRTFLRPLAHSTAQSEV